MYKLELFKDGRKIKELIFLDNEIEVMNIYRLKNHWDGGTSNLWKLINDKNIEIETILKKIYE